MSTGGLSRGQAGAVAKLYAEGRPSNVECMTVGSDVGKKNGGDAEQQEQQPVKRVDDTTQPGVPLGEDDDTPTDEHAALGDTEESTDEHAVIPG